MKYKFFNIPSLDSDVAETKLNDFCTRHRVAQTEKQFVADGANSFWSICITWLDHDGAISKQTGSNQRKPKVDYKEVLNDDEFHLFSQLRDLRKSLANQEGTPVYNIFTNEQLASIVRQNISSKAELLELDGVGETRVKKYGDIFIKQLRQSKNNETSDR